MDRLSVPLGMLARDDQAIAELGEELLAAEHVALDTEFMRERTYRAQLCLLQIATPARCVCVDPLGPVPLAPLAAGLQNVGVVKIMHAARQDLEVLWPLFGALPRLFDTQLAAALAGWPAQVGYADLVRQVLGITLSKGQTRTDWSRRPLSAEQVEYALDDVAYLASLKAALEERIAQLGREAWLAEELAALGRPEDLFVAPENAWERLKGLNELDPWRRELARELAAWRERRASERNRPRSWILPDNVLRGMVLRVPRSRAELAALEDMAPGFVEHSGDEVLALIDSQRPPQRLAPPNPRPRPDPQFTALVKRLGEITRQIATHLGVSPELLATRRDLEALAQGDAAAAPLRGWRSAVVGEQLRAAL